MMDGESAVTPGYRRNGSLAEFSLDCRGLLILGGHSAQRFRESTAQWRAGNE